MVAPKQKQSILQSSKLFADLKDFIFSSTLSGNFAERAGRLIRTTVDVLVVNSLFSKCSAVFRSEISHLITLLPGKLLRLVEKFRTLNTRKQVCYFGNHYSIKILKISGTVPENCTKEQQHFLSDS